MSWKLEYLPEAVKDLKSLAGNQRLLVVKAIEKVRKNPLPDYEHELGKPLGNKSTRNLSGFLKIKLKNAEICVVYQIKKTDTEMLVIVIGARADDEVYDEAAKRIKKHNL